MGTHIDPRYVVNVLELRNGQPTVTRVCGHCGEPLVETEFPDGGDICVNEECECD